MSKRPLVVSTMTERIFSAGYLAEEIGARHVHYTESPLAWDWSTTDLLVYESPLVDTHVEKRAGWTGILWQYEALRRGIPIIYYMPDVLTHKDAKVGLLQRRRPEHPYVLESGRRFAKRYQLDESWVTGPGTAIRYMTYQAYISCLPGPPIIHMVHYKYQQQYVEWMTKRYHGFCHERIFFYDPTWPMLADLHWLMANRVPSLLEDTKRQPAWVIDALRVRNQLEIDKQIQGKLTWPVWRFGSAGYPRVPAVKLLTHILPAAEGTLCWAEYIPSPPGHYRFRFHMAAVAGTVLARTTDSFSFLAIPIELVPTCLEVEHIYKTQGSAALREISARQYQALLDLAPPKGLFLAETWPKCLAYAHQFWFRSKQGINLMRRMTYDRPL